MNKLRLIHEFLQFEHSRLFERHQRESVSAPDSNEHRETKAELREVTRILDRFWKIIGRCDDYDD